MTVSFDTFIQAVYKKLGFPPSTDPSDPFNRFAAAVRDFCDLEIPDIGSLAGTNHHFLVSVKKVRSTVRFTLPSKPYVAFLLDAQTGNGTSTINCFYGGGQTIKYFEIRDISIGFHFSVPGFSQSLRYEGAIRLAADKTITFTPSAQFSIPETELESTGVVFSAQNLAVDFTRDDRFIYTNDDPFRKGACTVRAVPGQIAKTLPAGHASVSFQGGFSIGNTGISIQSGDLVFSPARSMGLGGITIWLSKVHIRIAANQIQTFSVAGTFDLNTGRNAPLFDWTGSPAVFITQWDAGRKALLSSAVIQDLRANYGNDTSLTLSQLKLELEASNAGWLFKTTGEQGGSTVTAKVFNQAVAATASLFWEHTTEPAPGRPNDRLRLVLKSPTGKFAFLNKEVNGVEEAVLDISDLHTGPDRQLVSGFGLKVKWGSIKDFLQLPNLPAELAESSGTLLLRSVWVPKSASGMVTLHLSSEVAPDPSKIYSLIPLPQHLLPVLGPARFTARGQANYPVTGAGAFSLTGLELATELLLGDSILKRLPLLAEGPGGALWPEKLSCILSLVPAAGNNRTIMHLSFARPLTWGIRLDGAAAAGACSASFSFSAISLELENNTISLLRFFGTYAFRLPGTLHQVLRLPEGGTNPVEITIRPAGLLADQATKSLSGDFEITFPPLTVGYLGHSYTVKTLRVGIGANVLQTFGFLGIAQSQMPFSLFGASGGVETFFEVQKNGDDFRLACRTLCRQVAAAAGPVALGLDYLLFEGEAADVGEEQSFTAGLSFGRLVLVQNGSEPLFQLDNGKGRIFLSGGEQRLELSLGSGVRIRPFPESNSRYQLVLEKKKNAEREVFQILIETENVLEGINGSVFNNLTLGQLLPANAPFRVQEVLPHKISVKNKLECRDARGGGGPAQTSLVYRCEVQVNDTAALSLLARQMPELGVRYKETALVFETDLAKFSQDTSGLRIKSFVTTKMGFPGINLPEEVEAYLDIDLGKKGPDGYQYVGLLMQLDAGSATGGSNVGIQCRIEDVAGFRLKFPGLDQPRYNIESALETVTLNAAGKTYNKESTFEFLALLHGTYLMRVNTDRLPLPAPFKNLFGFIKEKGISLDGEPSLAGKVTSRLDLKQGPGTGNKLVWSVRTTCSFDHLGVQLDFTDILQFFAKNGALPDDLQGATEIVTDDLGFGFHLKEAELFLSNDTAVSGDKSKPVKVLIRLRGNLQFLSTVIPYFIELSPETVSLGMDRFPIPLKFALPPITSALFDYTGDAGGADTWFLGKIASLQARLGSTSTSKKEKRNLAIQIAILQVARDICLRIPTGKVNFINWLRGFARVYEQTVSWAGGAGFETGGLPYIRFPELIKGNTQQIFGLDKSVNVFIDALFQLNLKDLRSSALSGSLKFAEAGFSKDNFLKIITLLDWRLGLSADLIYFTLKTPGTFYFPAGLNGDFSNLLDFEQPANPADALAKARQGYIRIDKALFGFGYTKRSLAIQLEGEIRLPDKLLAALEGLQSGNTGGLIYALPPRNTRLYFRFELIPIPVGQVVIVLPYFEFSLDLRSDQSPGLVSSRNCIPFWDGLRLHIRDIFEGDVKHIGFSPVFAGELAPIVPYSFDLNIGNRDFGLSHIADDFIYCFGRFNPAGLPSFFLPVPFLFDPGMPWVDNLCTNIRFAGFGINFNFQRPLPSFGLDALLETLAMLSDPGYKIDPKGSLANSMRVALTDVSLTLPDYARSLFPQLTEKLVKPVDLVLNIATFQHLFVELNKQSARLRKLLGAQVTVAALVAEIKAELSPAVILNAVKKILESLPLSLRTFSARARFGGFDGDASLAFVGSGEIKALLANAVREGRMPVSVSATAGLDELAQQLKGVNLSVLAEIDPGTMAVGYTAGFRSRDGERELYLSNYFKGLDAATADELAKDAAQADKGILTACTVRFFGIQEARFFGYIWQGQSGAPAFSLLSTVMSEPFQVAFGEIAVPVPLRVKGRLKLFYAAPGNMLEKITGYIKDVVEGTEWMPALAGMAKTALQGTGFIEAGAYAEWKPLPGVLEMALGSEHAPCQFLLDSTGAFVMKGNGSISLFNGSGKLGGSLLLTPRYCYGKGEFLLKSPALAGLPAGSLFSIAGNSTGYIGPGNHFEWRGAILQQHGANLLFGLQVTGSFIVNERGLQVKGTAATQTIEVNGFGIRFGNVSLGGQIEFLPPDKVAVAVECDLDMEIEKFKFPTGGELPLKIKVEGKGRFSYSNEKGLKIFTEGNITWNGQRWFGGAITITRDFLELKGHTKAALDSGRISAKQGLPQAEFEMDLDAVIRLDLSGKKFYGSMAASWRLNFFEPITNKNIAFRNKRWELRLDPPPGPNITDNRLEFVLASESFKVLALNNVNLNDIRISFSDQKDTLFTYRRENVNISFNIGSHRLGPYTVPGFGYNKDFTIMVPDGNGNERIQIPRLSDARVNVPNPIGFREFNFAVRLVLHLSDGSFSLSLT